MTNSETPKLSRRWLLMAAGVVGIVIVIVAAWPRAGPDRELARIAREAIEMAHEAQTDAHAGALWSGRLRLLALVVGVSAPLVIAYLIWRSSSRGEPDTPEMLARIEQYVLPASRSPGDPVLPSPEKQQALTDSPDDPTH